MTNHGITHWRKSSRTIDNPKDYNCVEVGHGVGVTGVRDSKNRTGPALFVSHAQFLALVSHVTE